jgi:hypothetical protein
VQRAVPGELRLLRRARREALGGVGAEHQRRQGHAHSEGPDQPRRPPPAAAAGQRPVQSDGEGDQHRAGDGEVGDLDPAQLAVGQQAPGVPGEVEAVPGQRLGQRHHDVERAGDDAVAQQRLGHPHGPRWRVAGGAGQRGASHRDRLEGHPPAPFGSGPVTRFDPARYRCLERREADSTRSRNFSARSVRAARWLLRRGRSGDAKGALADRGTRAVRRATLDRYTDIVAAKIP